MSTHDAITRAADVAARAFDLVDEFRWRFDAAALTFRESILDHPAPYIESLVILGMDDNRHLMLYSTHDLWIGDVLVHARVDAGGRFLEAQAFGQLYALASAAGLESVLVSMRSELPGLGAR